MTAGLIQDPVRTTPARAAGSVRRTSHVDMIFVGDGLRLRGAARDLFTDDSRIAHVQGEANIDAHLDAHRIITRITNSPATPAIDQLLGITVGKGFRAATAAAVPEEQDQSTPLFLLLDELPVASLISGYARLYTGEIEQGHPRQALKADICAGWRRDGTMMLSIGRGDGVPLPVGPEANPLELPGDEFSWHRLETLPAGAMRRRRLIDVNPGAMPHVWAMFRDTHVAPTGAETVLHEYVVEGRVDPASRTLTECAATPRVLPWVECPEAAASAGLLVGQPLTAIRDHVRADLNGTSTCTHLNDLLRSLGDLDALVDKLET